MKEIYDQFNKLHPGSQGEPDAVTPAAFLKMCYYDFFPLVSLSLSLYVLAVNARV